MRRKAPENGSARPSATRVSILAVATSTGTPIATASVSGVALPFALSIRSARPRRSPSAAAAGDDVRAAPGCSSSPIAIPSSRAHPSSTFASGTTSSTPAATPSKTSPVAPSIVITVPSASVRPPMATTPSPITTSDAPTTAGIPHPRATTAACEAKPPVDVRIPVARPIPCTSSGEVSARTRITSRPASATATAASGVSAISPQATPGDAGRPVVRTTPPSPRLTTVRGGSARIGPHPFHGLGPCQREGRVLGHLDRHPHGRLGRALPDPDLEQEQAALLDRELDVAAVAVVVLEALGVGTQLCLDGGQARGKAGDRLGPVRAGHHVLALGVEQDVAVEQVLAGRRVACEQHPGSRGSSPGCRTPSPGR